MKNDISSISNCKRIAIMGGTFDPIHYGHLVAAEAVLKEFSLEKILFIPTGQPSHKENNMVSFSEHRYLMTALAIGSNPFFDISRIEIDRHGPTYTIDTIRELRKCCRKDLEIYFITGADAVHEILTWKDADVLLSLCKFIAVTRPGYKISKLTRKIADVENRMSTKIRFLEIPALSISSSEIRNRVRNGRTIKYLLPLTVEQYIYKFNLYKVENINDLIIKKLRSVLSEKRVIHSISVADESKALANKYGEDEEKAYICGLLHDIAKEIPASEKVKLCKVYRIKLDPLMKMQIDLSHSFLSAEIARHKFDIVDVDMLNAIKYHTTGRKKMSLLEKIVYIADCIEPNRVKYNGLEEIKKYAYTDINKALEVALTLTIDYNAKNNREVHHYSTEALKHLKKNGGKQLEKK